MSMFFFKCFEGPKQSLTFFQWSQIQ